jgi:hypothetical protein
MIHLGDVIQDAIAAGIAGTGGGHRGLSLYSIAAFAGYVFWGLGPIFAVVGLIRAERPRWPALLGLLLTTLPLLTTALFSYYVDGRQ